MHVGKFMVCWRAGGRARRPSGRPAAWVSAGWLAGCVAGCLPRPMAGWPTGWPAVWPGYWPLLAGWLAGWLARSLARSLADWLAALTCPCVCGKAGELAHESETTSFWSSMVSLRHCPGIGVVGGRAVGMRGCVVGGGQGKRMSFFAGLLLARMLRVCAFPLPTCQPSGYEPPSEVSERERWERETTGQTGKQAVIK